MKYNWKPSKVAFLDFETQSEVDLSKANAKIYAKDKSTCILTCCVKVDGKMHRFGPYLMDDDKERLKRVTEGCVVVAHNAPFDEAVWEAAGLPDREWYDTLRCARAAGLPGGLDQIGKVLFNAGKDPNGKRLVDMLCIVKKGRIPAIGPAHQLLLDYNERDVELLESVYVKVHGFGEPEVMSADAAINDRGVPVSREYLLPLVEMYAKNTLECNVKFAEKVNINPRSVPQTKEWLLTQGFNVPALNKNIMSQLNANPDTFFVGDDESIASEAFIAVKEALELRREVVRVGGSKANTALELLESDGRIRDQFVYYGAHTGRWTGRRLQMHNLPSVLSRTFNSSHVEPNIECVKSTVEKANIAVTEEAATRGEVPKLINVSDVLGTMIRHIVRADNLLVADYNAVESRCVAWLADCNKMLSLYKDKTKSVYLDMGTQVFGKPISKKDDVKEYVLAKALVLGCCYGMSGAKFLALYKSRGEDTSAMERAGLTAFDAVKLYRKAYPEIPTLWARATDALNLAVRGVPVNDFKCRMRTVGSDLHLVLPSGRPIVYRNARLEKQVPGYCKLYGLPEVAVDTVAYDNPKGFTDFLWGSKLVENISSGVCRDILAEALVNLESAGIPVVLHVHDEVGSESDRFEEFMRIVSAPPTWAEGFPVVAEGYSGPVWTKTPEGYREATYYDGKAW